MITGILIGIVAFLLLLFIYISTVIGGEGREHFLLRLVLIIFFLQMLILIASDAQQVCGVYGNYSDGENYYGNNFSAYHWEYPADPVPTQTQQLAYILHYKVESQYKYYCFDNPTKSSVTFLKLTQALNYIFWVYCIIYISYLFLIKKGVIKQK